MSRLKIATWNLQTDKPFPQWRADAVRLAMDPIQADVWVITEPLLTFSPGAEYRLVAHSCEAADLERGTDPQWAADRRWVTIWSKVPARKLEVLGEPDRMACVCVEQPGHQDVVVVGTVLPWKSDPKWTGAEGKGFREALDNQAVEWSRLWGTPRAAGFCVAGDFNQSLPYTPHYGTQAGEKALRRVLESLGLICLTGDDADPLPATAKEPSIDHICVSKNLQPLVKPPSRTWDIPHGPRSNAGITDHYGVCAEVSVAGSDCAESLPNDSVAENGTT